MFFRPITLFVASLVTGVAVTASIADASSAKNPRGSVLIPFEQDRAQSRGDRNTLRLNDDVTIVPSHRIRALPIINGRMGEHVDLDGVRLHFPFGRIVTATTEFSQFRPSALNPSMMEPNPDFAKTAHFDHALGPACAQTVTVEGPLEMRMGSQGTISLVKKHPDTVNPTYRVTTALDVRHLAVEEPQAADLYRSCLQGGRKTAKN